MSRKKKAPLHVGTITALEQFRMARPAYAPACRCGAHGDLGYNRRKSKADARRRLSKELG